MSFGQSDLLLSTSQTSQQWTACLWDYTSGNSIQTYKNGGVAAPKTLNVIGNDYILTAKQAQPLLHVWQINSQEQLKNIRLVLPEPASAVTVCPYNTYLAAAIGSKLYIWQIATGRLLCVQQKHLQPITRIVFIDNDFLITAGQDGMLVVYKMGSLVSFQSNILPQNETGQAEPLYAKLDHSLPIIDVHVGNFGFKSRIATVSSDQTCKIYSLVDGQSLLALVFNEPLTAVIFDVACWYIYVGTNSGKIHQFNLKNPPRTVEHHIKEDVNKDDRNQFIGHTKKINSLCLNISCEILASGGDDCLVLIWEIKSKQILKKLEHKAPITNICFVLRHENIFVQTLKPQYVLKTLQRSLDFGNKENTVPIIQNEKIEFSDDELDENIPSVNKRITHLEAELDKSNVINKQLYDGMIKLIKKYNKVD